MAAAAQPWVNLAGGIIEGDTRTQCVAGCGTLLLEFGQLSRLSGNNTYHDVALRALRALWSRRSSLGLLGNTIDYETGQWTNENAGIGGGVDSFYEYLVRRCARHRRRRSCCVAWLWCLTGKCVCLRVYDAAPVEVLHSLRHSRWNVVGDVGRILCCRPQTFEARAVVVRNHLLFSSLSCMSHLLD